MVVLDGLSFAKRERCVFFLRFGRRIRTNGGRIEYAKTHLAFGEVNARGYVQPLSY